MRVFLCLCSVLAALAIAGCGGDDESTPTTTQAATTADTVAREAGTTESAPETQTEQAQAPETEREPAETTEEPAAPPGGDGDDASAGSGDDEEGAASAAALDFLDGLAKGNGDQACGAMSDRIREQVEKGLAQAPAFKGKSCAEILTTVTSAYPEQMKKQLVDVKVLGVTVKGEVARVTYRAGTLPKTSMPLMRVNGEWKVGALATPRAG